MSECISSAPNNKGAIQYTHLFLCISSGRRLTNFSMRSLYFQIHLHPSLCPLISHSVWCHRPDVHFNAAFYVELSKLQPLTINDLSISFDLYSRQLQSSSLLGIAKLPLTQMETLQKGKKPITYFYHQDPVDLIDPFTPTPVGNIFVTVALGYEEQMNLIEPQTRFIQVQIMPIDKKNTKYPSPSNWMKAAHKHGWMSIEEIEENWIEIAQSNGWKPYQKNENLTLETFKPINILKEYEAPPTADLLTIQPDSNIHPLLKEPEIIKHELFQPEKIIEILPQPKIKFKNKIKKPITVMDFFPRLSYTTKYENNEKSDSDFDQLIGKYLKTSSSTTLKSFPKKKRTKSTIYFSKQSKTSNKNQKFTVNSKSQNFERSSSQNFVSKKSSNSVSQSESFDLDSNSESDDMNTNSKNDQNQFKNSKNSNKNKKYDLDEKEWSSDFFSDSPDTTSNQLGLDLDADSQDNKKIDKGLFGLTLEEIVEKEMEKLSKNSKKPNLSQNCIGNSKSEDSNKVIQLNEDSFKIQNSYSENLNEGSQKVEQKKTVFFSPPPSLTQVIQKIDNKKEDEFQKSSHLLKQKVSDSKSSIDKLKSKVESLNIDDDENNENSSFLNYSNLKEQQTNKKAHKKKHHTKSPQNQNTIDFSNIENDQNQLNQEQKKNENNSQFGTFSNTIEKTTIKRRNLHTQQNPSKIQRNREKFVNEEETKDEVNSSTFSNDATDKNRFYTENHNDQKSLTEITSQVNQTDDTNHDTHNFSEQKIDTEIVNKIDNDRHFEEDFEQSNNHFTSPPTQLLNSFTKKNPSFSAPSHRRHHNEDDLIEPFLPYREMEEKNDDQIQTEKVDTNSQKVNTIKRKSKQRSNQVIVQKGRKRKKSQQTDSDVVDNYIEPDRSNSGDFSNFEFEGGEQRFLANQDEEGNFTSPKSEFWQENRQEASYSAPRHRHKRRKMAENDDGYIQPPNRSRPQHYDEQPNINSNSQYDLNGIGSHRPNKTEGAVRPSDDADFSEKMGRCEFLSAMKPPRLAQTQRITAPVITATMQPYASDDEPQYSEKVSHKKNMRQSPEVSGNSKASLSPPFSNPARSSHGRPFLPSAGFDPSLFYDHLSSEVNSSKGTSSNRSFIPTSRSMVDKRPNTKKRKSSVHSEDDNINSSSTQLPHQLHSTGNVSNFIEPVSRESGLKKRTKRSSQVRSNSPNRGQQRSDSMFGNNERDPFSMTVFVHSPTKAKIENTISPQMIDFSSTSPHQLPTVRRNLQASHKKRVTNRQLSNDITSQPPTSPPRKKVRTTKNRNTNDQEQVKSKGEISQLDSPSSSSRKRSSAVKSPTRREKKVPKKPMDIKPASSFGPAPLSPATPNAQKKGIRMSPSLERMINGIDKLETSFDMSGIGSDSDDD